METWLSFLTSLHVQQAYESMNTLKTLATCELKSEPAFTRLCSPWAQSYSQRIITKGVVDKELSGQGQVKIMLCKCAAIAEALLRDHWWFKLQRWASKWMRRLQALWRSPLRFAVITHWMGDIKKLLTPSRFSAITERFPHRSASQSFSHLEMHVPHRTTRHTSCFIQLYSS